MNPLDRIASLSPQKRELLAQRNPLSFSQQRLWFLDQLEPGDHSYNIPIAVRLDGPLSVSLLGRAVTEIVRRHQVLRSCFPAVDGRPLQVAIPVAEAIVPVVDLSGLPPAEREAEALRLAEQEARLPVNLAAGPVLRIRLLRLSSSRHVFLLMMHHIVSDGWSFEVFLRELGTLYSAFSQGRPSPLPELSIQYLDFARWQRQWLQGEALAGLLSYWKAQLAGIPAALDLPADHPRPMVQTFRGDLRNAEVAPELAAALGTLAREHRASLFMTLLAAFQALLCRYSGQRDIVVGSPMVNRNRVELEGLVGFFLNTLVLRTRFTGDPSFRDLLGEVRETVLAAHAHQDLPFERLVDELQPERHVNRQPLFQVMFTLKSPPKQASSFAGLTVSPLDVRKRVAKFDLTLSFTEKAGRLLASLEYNRDIFEDVTAIRLLDHLESLLRQIVLHLDSPVSGLELLTAAERAQLLVEWNGTRTEFPSAACVHHLIEAQAERRPDAVALIFQERRLTYRDLNRQANRLAHRLMAMGVGLETIVGICLERSAEMVVAVLAVLKAGAAYVPLDPSYPRERLAYMLEESAVPVLLTEDRLLADLPYPAGRAIRLDTDRSAIESESDQAPRSGAGAENLAYVIYTSGSTGKPKGVQVPHRGVVNIVDFMRRELGVTEEDRLLAVTTLSFDIAALEIYLPLAAGACVEVVGRETAGDGAALRDRLASSGATIMQATPATWQLLLDAGWLEGERLRILCGGEALSPVLARELAARCRGLWNVYGPTETTIWSTTWRVQGQSSGPVSIGRPMANTQVHLLAPQFEPVPIGVPGELYIGGLGLARGYFLQPGATAAKFVPDPFSEAPGARLYRTGDLARYRQDGSLEFLGRVDTQVKVRGFRIELEEIETFLLSHPSVRNAVVVAREQRGYMALVAYLVPGEPAAPAVRELRAFLGGSLPEYMVPTAFVFLDSLPLTPSGKVDRRALPAPGESRVEAEGSFVAPETVVQEMVVEVWSEILGRERIGIHDSFFELGGHSLLATRVVSRLRDCLGVSLPLRTVFESPTVASLALAVEAARRGAMQTQAPPLMRVSRTEALPLSFSQERLWFLNQLDEGSPAYNLAFNLRLRGGLAVRPLAGSLVEIVNRHEALRTTFTVEEGGRRPLQRIGSGPGGLPLIDLDSLPEAARSAEVVRLCGEQARFRFDLERGPLLRMSLLRSGPEEHVLLLTVHHIVFDGWSQGVFLRELSWLYRGLSQGEAPGLPELPVQYADFAVSQRQWLQGPHLEEQLGYWRGRLGDAPAALELPTDRPRPAVQTFRGAQKRFSFAGDLASRLLTLGRGRGATSFMTLLAGFQVLLSRYTGQSDLTVGMPSANRSRSEIEGLIGFFVNTLVLRAALAGVDSFIDVLSQARETALGAYDHQELPFEKLVEELRPDRDLGRSPLFQVMLLPAEKASAAALDLPGLEVEPLAAQSDTSKFELTLGFLESGPALSGFLIYNRDLFDGTTMDRLLGHFEVLLRGLVAAPDGRWRDLPLLMEEERQQLAREWNRIEPGFLEVCIHELFEAQVERTPDAMALVCGGDRLSYRELDERAQRLSDHLRSLGVCPEVMVGVFLDRSTEMVVGLLGALKSGGAYVPLDPSYPAERLAFIMQDSGVSVLLTRQSLLSCLPPLHGARVVPLDEALPVGPVMGKSAVLPRNLAYLIYTSGSTGRAKGVAIEHRSAATFLQWAHGVFPVDDLAGVFASTSICFDLSIYELFAPLTCGGKVVLGEDALGISTTPAAREVTLINTVPSAISELVRLGAVPPTVRTVNLAGEILGRALVERIYEQTAVERIFNLYGPSESTTYSTFVEVERGAPGEPSVGRPIDGTRLHLLDGAQQCVPIGVVGELFLGGEGLARGYWKRPELTAEKFVPDPLGLERGGRLYRTGDLARYRADGEIEFLGRIDHQVKVRGYRVELGEIESILTKLPGIRDVVVIKEAADTERLIAYLVPVDAGAFSIEETRRSLAERLPKYMVPSVFLLMESLPLTPNGKIERKALPRPEGLRPRNGDAVALRTPTEALLSGIWAEVLRVEPASIGRNDNFFDLGGHSLLAVQVLSRIREVLQVELSLQALFRSPCLADLAGTLQDLLADGGSRQNTAIDRLSQDGPLPISFAQQLLWFAHHLEPDRPDYNVPSAICLHGELDVTVLRRSVGEVVRRHEVLSSIFPVTENGPVQVVMPPAFDFRFVDLSELPAKEQEAEVVRLVWEEVARPFNLARGPLLRTALLRLRAEEHVAVMTLHHIVSDAWSIGVLVNEIAAHYRAFSGREASALPELPIQYSDFSRWQRQWLRDEVLEAQISYWKRQLGGGVPALDLPTDRPRPPVRRSRGGAVPVSLPESLSAELRELSRQRGNTLFMTLLSGFAALLHSYSRQEDFAIGTNVANRTRLETEGLIGFFVNQQVLRTDLSGDPSGLELLSRTRNVALAAFAHQDVPFDRVVEELSLPRDPSRSPLFQVKLDLLNTPSSALELPRLRVSPLRIDRQVVRYDLHLVLSEGERGIHGALQYNSDLFDAATAEQMSHRFKLLLSALAATPELRLSELEETVLESEREARMARQRERKKSNLQGLQQAKRRTGVR